LEYNLKVAPHQFRIHVEIHEDRNLTVVLDEKIFDVDYQIISDHQIHMIIKKDGGFEKVNAFLSNSPEGKTVCVNGRQYLACDAEKEQKQIKKAMSPDLPDRITPPMHAVVVRILAQAGDFVRQGQSLVVVSAMKMETTLCAPFDGIVVKINCGIHEKVMPGQILAEIKKAESGQDENPRPMV
jgi:biotin carboxyl carrier protein